MNISLNPCIYNRLSCTVRLHYANTKNLYNGCWYRVWGSGAVLFPTVKRPERGAGHSPPYSVKYTSNPPSTCLYGMQKDNFTFTFTFQHTADKFQRLKRLPFCIFSQHKDSLLTIEMWSLDMVDRMQRRNKNRKAEVKMGPPLLDIGNFSFEGIAACGKR